MININYNSLGEIQSIHIQINNYWASIPWSCITKSIDWNQIDYRPTRDSIQSAWNAWAKGKILSVELRARPDLTPAPMKPQPNWNAFNLGLILLPAYNNLMAQIPGYISGNLSVIAGQFATQNFSDYEILKSLWDSAIGFANNKPNAQDIQALNQLAQANNMPFSFASDASLALD